MARKWLSAEVVRSLRRLASAFAQLPEERAWLDYDRQADVLYVNFQSPQKATDNEVLEDGILVRYRLGQVVGITIFGASAGLGDE